MKPDEAINNRLFVLLIASFGFLEVSFTQLRMTDRVFYMYNGTICGWQLPHHRQNLT